LDNGKEISRISVVLRMFPYTINDLAGDHGSFFKDKWLAFEDISYTSI